MPWTKLDDRFHAHPKLLEVGLAGTGLYVRAANYSGAYLTDGRIPAAWVASQLGPDDAGLPDRLVEARLWERDGDAFVIPDFLVYNPSRQAVEAERERLREAGRKGGRASRPRSKHDA